MNNEEKQQNNKTDYQSHTNYHFLSMPQKIERLKNLHTQTRSTKQLTHLKAKFSILIESKGIAVEDDLHQHLSEIVMSSTDVIASSHPEGSFVHSF